jgi:hypothetical protein
MVREAGVRRQESGELVAEFGCRWVSGACRLSWFCKSNKMRGRCFLRFGRNALRAEFCNYLRRQKAG